LLHVDKDRLNADLLAFLRGCWRAKGPGAGHRATPRPLRTIDQGSGKKLGVRPRGRAFPV
jgi:hypothetical protein